MSENLQRRPIGAPKIAEEPEAKQWPESTDEYHVIPVQLAQMIIAYLDTQPHREVRSMIDGMLSCNPKAHG